MPEEFWSSETAKGLLVNSYATLYELPMIPFEMIEPSGEAMKRFLVTGKAEDAFGIVESAGTLLYHIGEFFAHQTANLSFAVSPFATEEQRQEGVNALFNDPIAPILAAFGIRHGAKSLESLPNVSSSVISKANMNLAKFKHAYEYYKSGKKAPKELLEYVEILENNKKVRTITEEQLSLDLKQPIETVKKKTEPKPVETKVEKTEKVEKVEKVETKPVEEVVEPTPEYKKKGIDESFLEPSKPVETKVDALNDYSSNLNSPKRLSAKNNEIVIIDISKADKLFSKDKG